MRGAGPILSVILIAGLVSSAPLAAPASPPAGSLSDAIRAVLSEGPLARSRVSLHVLRLDDGSVVFSSQADDLLNAASNVKLFTAAAALSLLGTDYRFETEFAIDAPLKNGRAPRLFVRGKGDPTIDTQRLYGVAAALHHAGLREVTGDLVIDDSWFDAVRIAPGFDQEDTDNSYMAPTGAVSLNWNTVELFLKPEGNRVRVELEPPSDFFVVQNSARVSKSARGQLHTASVAQGNRQLITLRGNSGPQRVPWSLRKKIDNPPIYFGETFKKVLAARGIRVNGRVVLGQLPARANVLHVYESENLDFILKKLNKYSSNFVAEQLVKTMGAVVKGSPGSFDKGIAAIEEFLEQQVGLPRGTYVMRNGSGLNDSNRFSASQVTKLLRHVSQRSHAPEFSSSLGIAGKDGTLRNRFHSTSAEGRLRAKTGTLERVTALSGYVQAIDGQRFAFAAIVNDYPGRAYLAIQQLDSVGVLLASQGADRRPAPPAAPAPQDVASAARRAKTYLEIARREGASSAEFLRSAWRAEKDGAVRAILAACVYQVDPGDGAARDLVKSYDPSALVFARVRQIGTELRVPIPGLATLADLASAGNARAIKTLIELSPAAVGDQKLESQLAAAFHRAALSAPDRLQLALDQTPARARRAAAGVWARRTSDEAVDIWRRALVSRDDDEDDAQVADEEPAGEGLGEHGQPGG